jgi:hypothetical protein
MADQDLLGLPPAVTGLAPSGKTRREFALLAASEFWPRRPYRLVHVSARTIEGLTAAVAAELDVNATACGGRRSVPLGMALMTNIGSTAHRQILTGLEGLPAKARVFLLARISYLALVGLDLVARPATSLVSAPMVGRKDSNVADTDRAALESLRLQQRHLYMQADNSVSAEYQRFMARCAALSRAQGRADGSGALADCQGRLAVALQLNARLGEAATVELEQLQLFLLAVGWCPAAAGLQVWQQVYEERLRQQARHCVVMQLRQPEPEPEPEPEMNVAAVVACIDGGRTSEAMHDSEQL